MGEFFFIALLTLVPVLCVHIDLVMHGGTPEVSATEFTQEALLLMSALLFGYGAWRYKNSRGFCVLVAGLLTCMLVRELDAYLDHLWHGCWSLIAYSVLAVCATYIIVCCYGTVLEPMSSFTYTRAYPHLVLGLIVVLVFSRIFGSKILLSDILGIFGRSGYKFKSVIQEGLELFGYVLIAYGSWLSIFPKKKCSFMPGVMPPEVSMEKRH
jgi:hypothetical protein